MLDDLTTYLYTAEIETEDSRTTWRRRLQQRRCLTCGSKQLVNNQTSYFCPAHIASHRYCSTCETLRTRQEHGKDSRCRACSGKRSLACYHANADRNVYRIRLKQIGSRRESRADQIFAAVRRRIALADLVRRTPGWSWRRRAALIGGNAACLCAAYRAQTRGFVADPDMADRVRPRRREAHDAAT